MLKKFLIPLLALLMVQPAFPAGKIVQSDTFRFGASGPTMVSGTVNPSTTATSAPAGSLYHNTTSGIIYVKQDAGSTTNWLSLGASAIVGALASYTPTVTGAGTVTNNTAYYRQIGNSYEVQGSFSTGTVSGALLSVTLPGGAALDTTKLTIANTTSNPGPKIGDYGANGTNQTGSMITATSTSTAVVYFANAYGSSGSLTPQTGTTALPSTAVTSYRFMVPISGLSGTFVPTEPRPVSFSGTCSSSATVASDASGVTIGNISSGACTITVPVAVFSAASRCTISEPVSTLSALHSMSVNPSSATSIVVYARDITAALTTYTYNVVCLGPR